MIAVTKQFSCSLSDNESHERRIVVYIQLNANINRRFETRFGAIQHCDGIMHMNTQNEADGGERRK